MASTDHIDLNLDTAERPADQVRPDFAFTWKDRRIVLTDPANVDYRSLLEVDSPVGFLKYTARQEDRDFLASPEGSMEGWRLGLLMEKYYKHFGMDKERQKLGF